MAKKINLADLVFKISDDGTLKAFSSSAKKAGKDIANVGKKTDETTYATKKGINMTANQTKNFANMSRGISGSLVPAYATLAANVFALTAVFGFLKSAADYRLLKEGQSNYAAVTGVAYKTLTQSIIRATDAQIKYGDAAQAAAIGIAAGLSPEQLEKIGAAAKTVSIALGRDVTDSFNRLVRGVTKAEPELLDELGIILRLDPATKKYAASLDISKDSLNAFQRTQAVTNEVLEQVEQKFNAINAIMDPQTNQINKLAKAFDDLTNQLKMMLAGPAEGLASFFANNVYAAAGALTIFALPIIKSILPAFDEWEANAVSSLQAHDIAVEKSSKKIQAYARLQQMNLNKAQANPAARLRNLSAGMDVKPGSALAKLQGGQAGALSKAQLANMKAQATKGIGIFKNMDATIKADWVKAMNDMSRATKVPLMTTVKATTTNIILNFKKTSLKIKATWQSAMIGIQRASAVTARVVSKAFGFLSFLSIAALAFEGFKAGAEKMGLFGEKSKEADDSMKGLLQRQKDFNKELREMMGKDQQVVDEGLTQTFNNILKNNSNKLIGAQLGKTMSDIAAGRAALSRPTSLSSDAVLKGRKISQNFEEETYRENIRGSTAKRTVTGMIAQERRDATQDELDYFAALKLVEEQESEYMKTVKALSEVFPELSTLVGKMPEKFDDLTDSERKFISSTILAGNAVKFLEQNASSADETIRKLSGTTNPAISNLQTLENQRDAFAAIRNAPGYTGDESTEAGFKKFGGLAKAQRGVINSTQALTAEKALNSARASGIKTSLIGSTQLGKRRTDLLKINTKIAEIAKLTAEITLQQKLIENEEGNTEDMQTKLTNMQNNLGILTAQKTAMEDTLNLTKQLGVEATKSFEDGMIKGIQGMIEGTMSLKDAFKSMAKGILSSLAQVLARMMAMKIMGGMFGVPMADGGVIPMAKGGITGYRNGGIATEPTYLVGEGKHNEAVVPLPNGRSIPVDMKGGNGGNNVVINVDASGSTSSTGSGEQGKALGMAIQAAVMETIQREKRPGGVLSRS